MELLKTKTEELFKFFNSFAPTCGKCGKEYSCVAIRYCDLVIGIYAHDCGESHMIGYRGVPPKTWEKTKEILGNKDLEELRTQEQAAMTAKIICPRCQKPMKYIESTIQPDGNIQHRFDCRNGFVRTLRKRFGRSFWKLIARGFLQKRKKKRNAKFVKK